jgi:hypothetical protein
VWACMGASSTARAAPPIRFVHRRSECMLLSSMPSHREESSAQNVLPILLFPSFSFDPLLFPLHTHSFAAGQCDLGCFACPAGTTADPSRSSCITCPMGYYCPGGRDMVPCGSGTYCAKTGLTAPTPCPGGSFCTTSTSSSTSATVVLQNLGLLAPVRQYASTVAASVSAFQCPAGTMCPQGSYAPKLCSAGKKADSYRSRCSVLR